MCIIAKSMELDPLIIERNNLLMKDDYMNLGHFEIIRVLTGEDTKIAWLTSFLHYHHAPSLRHSQRVGKLTGELGKRLGYKPEMINMLAVGGLLHDIGKLLVPAYILKRINPLSENDKKLLNIHSSLGGKILSAVGLEKYSIISEQHHIGNSQLTDNTVSKLEAKHPLATIVTLCDNFDAAIDKERKYQPTSNVQQALEMIRENFAAEKYPIELLAPFKEMILEELSG